MNISDLFTKEVNYIKNEHIKNMVIQTLNAAPEWLQVIPASSSGKYHPEYAAVFRASPKEYVLTLRKLYDLQNQHRA